MAQMTERRYKKMKEELVVAKENHAEALERQAAAKEFGDLSENAEYETARRAAESYGRKIAFLEDELANAEIVEEDNSPRITIGSTVDVRKVDASGNPLEEYRRFTVEERGDTIIQKILGTSSSLGKVILNGSSGIYKIPDNGGLYYQVQKVFE